MGSWEGKGILPACEGGELSQLTGLQLSGAEPGEAPCRDSAKAWSWGAGTAYEFGNKSGNRERLFPGMDVLLRGSLQCLWPAGAAWGLGFACHDLMCPAGYFVAQSISGSGDALNEPMLQLLEPNVSYQHTWSHLNRAVINP